MNITKVIVSASLVTILAAIAAAQTSQESVPNSSHHRRQLDSSAGDEGIRIPQPTEMSRAFDLLNSYSLFAKGRIAQSSGGGNSGGFDAQAPENVLVFTGVTVTDHATVGFIEGTSQQSVRQVKIGDSIAQGKITDITLDELDYQSNSGRKVRVAVGQNLRGENAFGLIYGTGIESEGPVVTDQNVDPGTAAILQRLRAKRLAELNGGPAPAATEPAQ
ncbi:MAG: hypothetical protein ABSF29_07560 [Tepidisphaeraceae bacterium]|jgi:hypothetical protein